MQGYKKLLFTALMAIFLIPVKGQNTDSPYSRYGYGILNNQSVGALKSMGGISYGVRGSNTNPGNPASYTALDSLTFIFDMGISYNKGRLTEGSVSQSHDNGGLDYLTMQFPVSRKLGVSIGLLPFSSVGYSFGSNETSDISSTKSFSGSGGFSQIYGGAAYKVLPNLSVGANVSYIFGNTIYNRALTISGIPTANPKVTYQKMVLNILRFDFGAQYTLPVKNDENLTLGFVFSPAVKTSGKVTRISNLILPSGTVQDADTIVYRGSEAYTDLPNKFGLGLTWNRNDNFTIGLDATYQTWSKLRNFDYMDDNLSKSNRFKDQWRFNAGIEYSIDPRDRSVMKRMKFRGGFNVSNSYINVVDNHGKISGYNEYGANIGVGIPIRDAYTNKSSYINIGLEYKNLSPKNSGLIKEQYFGVSLGVNLNDLWFMKNKFR